MNATKQDSRPKDLYALASEYYHQRDIETGAYPRQLFEGLKNAIVHLKEADSELMNAGFALGQGDLDVPYTKENGNARGLLKMADDMTQLARNILCDALLLLLSPNAPEEVKETPKRRRDSNGRPITNPPQLIAAANR